MAARSYSQSVVTHPRSPRGLRIRRAISSASIRNHRVVPDKANALVYRRSLRNPVPRSESCALVTDSLTGVAAAATLYPQSHQSRGKRSEIFDLPRIAVF